MSKGKSKKYFDVEEEEAVIDFISTESIEERTEIYRTRLKTAIDKLAESIINTYSLHRVGMTFEENHTDTISFLICQVGKFKPDRNKKAYSYFGTICKNYLVAEIVKHHKKTVKHNNYDDFAEQLEEDDRLSYTIEDEDINVSSLITKMVSEIQDMVEDPTKYKLNPNELKLGYALIEVFTNYDMLIDDETKNAKYDKNSILSTIRNYTNLTTKDIRVSMSKYKAIYTLIKEDEIENGSI